MIYLTERLNNISVQHKSCGSGSFRSSNFLSADTVSFTKNPESQNKLFERIWVMPEKFEKIQKVLPNSYVGKIPSSILQTGIYEQDVCLGIRELVKQLKILDLPEKQSFEFKLKGTNEPFMVENIGHGDFGTVYKLTINNRNYALKVYNKTSLRPENLYHSPYAEMATGLYFSQWAFKDLARFYFADTKELWSVFEFITPDMHAEKRFGRSIREFDVTLNDDRLVNNINGIRYDYGGITKKLIKLDVNNYGCYSNCLDSKCLPAMIIAINQLSKIPSGERFEAYKKAMSIKNCTVQMAAASKIDLLYGEEAKQAFMMALATNNPKVQLAAVSIMDLIKPYNVVELIKKALSLKISPDELKKNINFNKMDLYERAMYTHNTQVQAVAASKIPWLDANDRLEAYKIAMETQKPEVMAEAVKNLYLLPEEFIWTEFKRILRYEDPVVKYNACESIQKFPEDFMAKAQKVADKCNIEGLNPGNPQHFEDLKAYLTMSSFKTLMNPKQWDSQIQAVSRIGSMDPDKRFEAFRQAFATNKDDLQLIAVEKLDLLPYEDRLDAYKIALGTNNPKIQEAVVLKIDKLNYNERYEAYQLAMETQSREIQVLAAQFIKAIEMSKRFEAYETAINTGNYEVIKVAARQILSLPEQNNLVDNALEQFINIYNQKETPVILTSFKRFQV